MVKRFFPLFIIILILIPLSSSAVGIQTITDSEYDITFDIPDTWNYATIWDQASQEKLKKSSKGKEALDQMLQGNFRFTAADENWSTYISFITRSAIHDADFRTGIDDLSIYKDEMDKTLTGTGWEANVSEYRSDFTSFVRTEITLDGSPLSATQYETIFGGISYLVTFSYNAEKNYFDESLELATINSFKASLPSNDAKGQIIIDPDSNVSIEFPESWVVATIWDNASQDEIRKHFNGSAALDLMENPYCPIVAVYDKSGIVCSFNKESGNSQESFRDGISFFSTYKNALIEYYKGQRIDEPDIKEYSSSHTHFIRSKFTSDNYTCSNFLTVESGITYSINFVIPSLFEPNLQNLPESIVNSFQFIDTTNPTSKHDNATTDYNGYKDPDETNHYLISDYGIEMEIDKNKWVPAKIYTKDQPINTKAKFRNIENNLATFSLITIPLTNQLVSKFDIPSELLSSPIQDSLFSTDSLKRTMENLGGKTISTAKETTINGVHYFITIMNKEDSGFTRDDISYIHFENNTLYIFDYFGNLTDNAYKDFLQILNTLKYNHIFQN